MENILHKKIKNKVKRWSKGFADENRTFMYEESYASIEKFLKGSKEKKDFISLGSTCGILSTWYGADFLEQCLSNKGDYSYSLKQSMLWKTIDFLLYASGKYGDIKPIWFVDVCLSACNLLILQKVEEAYKLLKYASPEKINFKVEPPESVCQFVIKMFSTFYNDREIIYKFPKPLNEIYTNFLTDLMDKEKDDINASINKVCEFHLSRTKMYQEFDRETKMILPSEILAPLLLRKRMGLTVTNIEHPLIKDIFPVIEGLMDVETDPIFLKVIEYI